MRSGLRALLARGVASARFTARLQDRGARGHFLLQDVRSGSIRIEHVWLNQQYSDLQSIPLGSTIRFWADLRKYRKQDGERDVGLTMAREVEVLT